MGRSGRGGARGYGRGLGFGRGYWTGTALSPGCGRGIGMGMGNPYPYCRFYPWMPRRWWAMGMSPYSSGVPSNPSSWVGPQWT